MDASSAERLRVALFDPYSQAVGGAHAVWREIALAGQESGEWDATVVLPGEGPAAAWLRTQCVTVRVVPAPASLLAFGRSWKRRPWALLAALPRFWWGLRRELSGFDVVHLSDLRGLLLAGPCLLLSRTRRIVHIHGGDAGGLVWRVLAAALLRGGATVMVPSRAGAEAWSGRAGARLTELPNPVPELEHRVEGAAPLVVCIARLHPQKGVDVLLDALELLAARGQQPRTLVVGPDSPGLESLARDLRARSGRLPEVELIGQVPDASAHLAAAWVYVQPSREESFGLAALEASAVGLPVIASRVGGLRDVVVDGVTGILVGVEQPRELADALEHLLDSPADRDRLGAAGRERARTHFSRRQFTERLAAVYRQGVKQ